MSDTKKPAVTVDSPEFQALLPDDLPRFRRNEITAYIDAHVAKAVAAPFPITGLGSITNEDDGVLTLRFVNEEAADQFINLYEPTVDCRDMPAAAHEVSERSEQPVQALVVTDAMVDACYSNPDKIPYIAKRFMRETLCRALAAASQQPAAAPVQAAVVPQPWKWLVSWGVGDEEICQTEAMAKLQKRLLDENGWLNVVIEPIYRAAPAAPSQAQAMPVDLVLDLLERSRIHLNWLLNDYENSEYSARFVYVRLLKDDLDQFLSTKGKYRKTAPQAQQVAEAVCTPPIPTHGYRFYAPQLQEEESPSSYKNEVIAARSILGSLENSWMQREREDNELMSQLTESESSFLDRIMELVDSTPVFGDYRHSGFANAIIDYRTAQAAPASQVRDERAEFEAWVRKTSKVPEEIAKTMHIPEKSMAWMGWQARAALAAQTPVYAYDDEILQRSNTIISELNKMTKFDSSMSREDIINKVMNKDNQNDKRMD